MSKYTSSILGVCTILPALWGAYELGKNSIVNSHEVAIFENIETEGTASKIPYKLGLIKFERNLMGKWSGPISTERGRSYYAMELKIERLHIGDYSGKIIYTGGLNCSGLMTYRRKKSDIYVFDEIINKGSGCASTGRVEIYITENGKLHWEWFRPNSGGKPDAYAILNRLKT